MHVKDLCVDLFDDAVLCLLLRHMASTIKLYIIEGSGSFSPKSLNIAEWMIFF